MDPAPAADGRPKKLVIRNIGPALGVVTAASRVHVTGNDAGSNRTIAAGMPITAAAPSPR